MDSDRRQSTHSTTDKRVSCSASTSQQDKRVSSSASTSQRDKKHADHSSHRSNKSNIEYYGGSDDPYEINTDYYLPQYMVDKMHASRRMIE